MAPVGGIPKQTKAVNNHYVEANQTVRRKNNDAGMGNKYIYMLLEYFGEDAEISKDVHRSERRLGDMLKINVIVQPLLP